MLQDPLTELQTLAPLPGEWAVRLFCQDERRFGLLPRQRRQSTLTGGKPLGLVPYRFETF